MGIILSQKKRGGLANKSRNVDKPVDNIHKNRVCILSNNRCSALVSVHLHLAGLR